jgi:hypothetical protein
MVANAFGLVVDNGCTGCDVGTAGAVTQARTKRNKIELVM